MNPTIFYQTIRSHWKKNHTITFLSVFLFGLAAHAYKFFNLLPNYDSLDSLYSPQNTLHLGRCFLTLGCGISSYYDLSWVIGLLSLLYIAFSAICIQEIFDFKRPAVLILSSGILVTFPAVTNTFAFLFTADGYFLSMLLASLGVLLCIRFKKGYIPATLCFCLSLGMYQAYLLFAIVLTLLYGIKCLLFDLDTVSTLVKKLGRILIAGIGGSFFYYISYQTLLKIENISLSKMNGLSEMSIHNLPNLFDAAYNSIHDLAMFFFYSERGVTFYVILNIFFVIGLILLMLCFILKHFHVLGILRIVSSILFAGVLPFCIYLYYFFSKVQYHTIMLESIALLYLFPLLFLEHAFSKEALSNLVHWFLVILNTLIIYNFVLTANIAYTNMAHSFERSTSVINRMAARIEQLEDFPGAEKLAIIGELPGSNETIYNYPPDLSGTVPNYIMRIPHNYVYMLRNYNNLTLEEVNDSELSDLLSTPEYQSMDNWPAANSVQIIDKCVVIKLSEPKKE